MTIQEAEKIYHKERISHIADHELRMENNVNSLIKICLTIAIIGVILLLLSISAKDTVIKSLLITLIIIYIIADVVIFLALYNHFLNSKERGPSNFLPQIKRLYSNYLRCEDMSDNDKLYYKQRLEEIRNQELIQAINRASNTISTATTSAVLFSMINKK